MNVLARELQSCLTTLSTGEDGTLTATGVFPPEFAGFKGHFAGNPVLPGVCLVQAVLVMLARRKGTPARLKSIVSAKWFASVKPGMAVQFSCRERKERLIEASVRAKVTCEGAKIAELSLLVAYDADAKDGGA